ncbi:MAG: ORF6N domain-containing protein [Bacteroidia bacterium]|nr:ORF6N domain-containing protein [Bacteroidia bacterium]
MDIQLIQKKIFVIRGQRVMLDKHLAEMYGVPTKSINLAVKRNIKRFPVDFMFQLTKEEHSHLRLQIETSSWGGNRFLPNAFTGHGITMLSSVLKSETAINVNIAVVRAFIFLKQYNADIKILQHRIQELESKFNKKIENINEVIEFLVSDNFSTSQTDKKQKSKPVTKIGYKLPKKIKK